MEIANADCKSDQAKQHPKPIVPQLFNIFLSPIVDNREGSHKPLPPPRLTRRIMPQAYQPRPRRRFRFIDARRKEDAYQSQIGLIVLCSLAIFTVFDPLRKN